MKTTRNGKTIEIKRGDCITGREVLVDGAVVGKIVGGRHHHRGAAYGGFDFRPAAGFVSAWAPFVPTVTASGPWSYFDDVCKDVVAACADGTIKRNDQPSQ